ncbi:MAG: tetratricopeptide repeat protein [Planctomycetota bacterium]
MAILILVAQSDFRPAWAQAEGRLDLGTASFNAAVALQNRGEFELAAEEWARFLADNPRDSRRGRALHYLGVCQTQSGQFAAAEKSFDTVVQESPQLEMIDTTWLYLGVARYNIGERAESAEAKTESYRKAAEAFRTLLEKSPKSKHAAQALFYLGETLYAQGDRKAAVRFYGQLATEYPDDKLAPEAQYAMGVALEEGSDFVAASKVYDDFLKRYPQSPLVVEVGMRRGESDFAAGRYEEAAQRFAAAAAAPGFALADHAAMRYAAALGQLKRHREAADAYTALVLKHPKSALVPAARMASGRELYLAGQFEAAREPLVSALQAGGDIAAEAAHWLARSLLKLGRPAEALEVVERVLPRAKAGPWQVQLVLDRADAAYEILERRPEAAKAYAELADSHPGDALAPQARYMAAFAQLGLAKYDAAFTQAQRFLKDHASHTLAPDVAYIAAESLIQQQKYEEAGKLLEELVAEHGTHRDAAAWRVRLGLASFLQKRYDDTIAVLQPAVDKLPAGDLKAEANFLVGSSLLEQKRFDQAQKHLEASLEAAPQWRQADEALLALAQAQFERKDLPAARATLVRLIRTWPKSAVVPRAFYRLGEYYFATQDWKYAGEAYQRVLEHWPNDPATPHALYGLGWAQINQKDTTAAIASFTRLLKEHGKHNLAPKAVYARAVARHLAKDYEQAAADVEAFLASKPAEAERADALYLLALCEVGRGRHEQAVAALRRMLEGSDLPANADKAYYELGWALKSLGREDEAAKAFADLVRVAPESPLAAECLYHVGEDAYRREQFADAAKAYQSSAEKAAAGQEPDDDLGEKALHKLGWAQYRMNDFNSAATTFASQRERWPKGPLQADAAFMQGESLMKQAKCKEAVSAYAAATNLSSKDFQSLKLLHEGQALAQLGQWKESLALLDQMIEQFPQSPQRPEALYERGMALKNLDKNAEAVKSFEAVVSQTGAELAARAQFMIGEIQFESRDHKEAIKSFYKVIYAYGYPRWQADATYEAARCFEVLGKADRALEHYQELLQKFPESDKATLARDRVAALAGATGPG